MSPRFAPWRVGGALFVVAYGSNVFTPLLGVYRRQLGLSATMITSIFAMYAAGLLPGLLFAGPASDRVGRRRIAVPAVGLAGVASLVFVPAAGLAPLLYLARFLQGVVTGVVFSVASAWLQDLTRDPPVAARRASLAMNAGFCLGPIASGMLGQYGPAPTTLPFVVHVAVVAVGLAVIFGVGDVLTKPLADRRLLDFTMPHGTRRPFWLVLVPTAVCVFGFPSTAAAVLPLLLPVGGPSIAETGVIAGVTLGAAALVTPAAGKLRSLAAPVGAVCGAGGFAVAAVASHGNTLFPLIGSAVLLGCGSGLTVTAGLVLAQQLATQRTRGALSSAFYAWAYAGFAVPVIVTAAAGGGSLRGPLAAAAMVAAALAGWLAASSRWAPRGEPGRRSDAA
ncbi:MAG: MFS transporter [Nocardioidaceae bacterium]